MVCSRKDERVRLAASFNIYWKTVWEKIGIYSSWRNSNNYIKFKTLLAIIGSCQEFQGRESWRKVLWFRISTLTTIDRMTWGPHSREVIVRVSQRPMRLTCLVRAFQCNGLGNRNTVDLNLNGIGNEDLLSTEYLCSPSIA